MYDGSGANLESRHLHLLQSRRLARVPAAAGALLFEGGAAGIGMDDDDGAFSQLDDLPVHKFQYPLPAIDAANAVDPFGLSAPPEIEEGAHWIGTIGGGVRGFEHDDLYGAAAPEYLRRLILPLPNCDPMPAESIPAIYDPRLQPDLVMRELFPSMPPRDHCFGLFCAAAEEISGGGGVVDGSGIGVEFDVGKNLGMEYNSMRMKAAAAQGGNVEAKTTNYATERQRREQLKEKYWALKSLVPNPSKNDRASIVEDAMKYIKELQRTVKELHILVEQKKRRSKIADAGQSAAYDDAAGDMEMTFSSPAVDGTGAGVDAAGRQLIRSSWIQRRSKECFVDVRIVDDEANIKVTQKTKMLQNSGGGGGSCCLLVVAQAIDELGLSILHASGGSIGDHHVFIFNTKIAQGSSVYTGAIAKKLLEAMTIKQVAVEQQLRR